MKTHVSSNSFVDSRFDVPQHDDKPNEFYSEDLTECLNYGLNKDNDFNFEPLFNAIDLRNHKNKKALEIIQELLDKAIVSENEYHKKRLVEAKRLLG